MCTHSDETCRPSSHSDEEYSHTPRNHNRFHVMVILVLRAVLTLANNYISVPPETILIGPQGRSLHTIHNHSPDLHNENQTGLSLFDRRLPRVQLLSCLCLTQLTSYWEAHRGSSVVCTCDPLYALSGTCLCASCVLFSCPCLYMSPYVDVLVLFRPCYRCSTHFYNLF